MAAIVEEINQRIPELREQALAARDRLKTQPVAAPSKAEQEAQEKRSRAETGERIAERYRNEARQKYAAGDLLGASAAYRASLQALGDAMELTPVAEIGRRTQLRNAITEIETDQKRVSEELKKGQRQSASVVDENAETEALPPRPLFERLNTSPAVPPIDQLPSQTFTDRLQERAREDERRWKRGNSGADVAVIANLVGERRSAYNPAALVFSP